MMPSLHKDTNAVEQRLSALHIAHGSATEKVAYIRLKTYVGSPSASVCAR